MSMRKRTFAAGILSCRRVVASLTMPLIAAAGLSLSACPATDASKKFTATPTPKSPGASTTVTVGPDSTYTLSLSGPTLKSLVTKDTASVADATCTDDVRVLVQQAGAAKIDVKVVFAVVSTDGKTDIASAEPTNATTDSEGYATSKVCSGTAEGSVTMTVRAGATTTNTAAITVAKRAIYAFRFKGTEDQGPPPASNLVGPALDATAEPTAAPAGGTTSDTIDLNLFGAGKDCTTLLFEATKSGAAFSGQTVVFKSQSDYPVGAKLALKSVDIRTTANSPTYVGATPDGCTAGTNCRYYLKYSATSDSSGIFKVPVCAGFLPGNLLVNGELSIIDQGQTKLLRADAPMVKFDGGVANYGNISLSMDSKNAKVLRGLFNNNTGEMLNFTARLQSRLDGVLAMANPLAVLTEFGKPEVANDGKPNEKGQVAFSLESLNLNAFRPVRVSDPYLTRGTRYSPMCDQGEFTEAPVTFRTLAKDWRTTMMWYVKGQEQFFDANRNGIFDESVGVGFWDKNQNGVFDCAGWDIEYTTSAVCGQIPAATTDYSTCDVMTYVGPDTLSGTVNSAAVTIPKASLVGKNYGELCTALSANQFRLMSSYYQRDWFIDMPSPFVDSNENGIADYDANNPDSSEYVVGDTFQSPNGIFDSDAYIWKQLFLPIYVGTSPYAISHRVIYNNRYETFATYDTDPNDSVHKGLAYYMKTMGYEPQLWDTTATVSDIDSSLTAARGIRRTLWGCYQGTATNNPGSNDCVDGNIDFTAAATPGNGLAAWRYFFAQGTCGSPMSGQTQIHVDFTNVSGSTISTTPRTPQAYFYIQPGDDVVEPARRILSSDPKGGASATINFDPTNHPARSYGYPIQFVIRIPACTTACSGDLATSGNYCAAETYEARLYVDTDSTPQFISLPQVKTCTCAGGGATFNYSTGACTCPSGTTNKGGTCQ